MKSGEKMKLLLPIDPSWGVHDARSQKSQGQKGGKRDARGTNPVLKAAQWVYKLGFNYGPVNCPLKALMTAAAAWLLSRAVLASADVKMAELDVIVYSGIYCGWVIFFLPDVLLHLNSYMLGKLFAFFLRLFFAELFVGLYLHCRGDSNILQRGLSLRPLLGPAYQWMEELVHSVRLVLIVGCLSASLVANLFDRPEILIEYVVEDDDAEEHTD